MKSVCRVSKRKLVDLLRTFFSYDSVLQKNSESIRILSRPQHTSPRRGNNVLIITANDQEETIAAAFSHFQLEERVETGSGPTRWPLDS